MPRLKEHVGETAKARELASHLEAVVLNLAAGWKSSPGVPEIGDRVRSLPSAASSVAASVTSMLDNIRADGIATARGAVAELSAAVLDLIARPDVELGLPVLRQSLSKVLELAYGVEQVVDGIARRRSEEAELGSASIRGI